MEQKTIIIGIAGASGSGKSLMANTIVDEIGSDRVAVISEDSYYKDLKHLPFEERAKTNFDHPDAFDHPLFCEHLKRLQKQETVEIPIYNHAEHVREDRTITIAKHAIIVLEGILLFADRPLREMMDIRVYMDTPLDVCLIRRLKRDIIQRKRTVESVIEQYEKTVRPMYLQFIEPTKRYADIIVPRGGANRIAIDLMKAKIRELLGSFVA
ncbi:MAG: uridine kinase [Legionellales bacterium]|nr:uridine kinase [Legionellales bacterium]